MSVNKAILIGRLGKDPGSSLHQPGHTGDDLYGSHQ